MLLVEDEQLAAFAPRLDAQFRARCLAALRLRGQWAEERLERAVDTALGRARALGLSEERSVLAYLLLATDVALARPEEHVARAVEAILGDASFTEWQRVRLADDYFRQMHQTSFVTRS
jgi:hypothetical protein